MRVDCAITRNARQLGSRALGRLISGMPAIVVDQLGGSAAALCLVYPVKQHPFACAMPHRHRANEFSRRVPGVHLWRYHAACKVWVPAKWESKINGGKNMKWARHCYNVCYSHFVFVSVQRSSVGCRQTEFKRFCMKISCIRSSNFLCPSKSFWLIADIF